MKQPQFKSIIIRGNLFLFLVLFLCFERGVCQPTVLYSTINSSNRIDLTDKGLFRQGRLQCNQSGTQFWAFHLGTSGSPNYSSNWRPYDAGNVLTYNNYIPIGYTNGARYNGGGGTDGQLNNVQHGYYYTFNVTENASDNRMQLLQTSYNPVLISTVTQFPISCKGPSDMVSITITTASAPASGVDINTRENIFVRYSTDGYVTSNVVQATFTGNIGVAIIPAITSGSVSYYVYSSNEDLTEINNDVTSYGQSGHDMATLNLNNNSGTNYSYTIVNPKIWDGTSWSPAGNPTAADRIVFNAGIGTTFNSSSDLSACSCQISSGTVNINAGHTLNLINGLTVSGGALFFKDDSSLVQTNNVVNSGNITYERMTNSLVRDTDYTYWASPVTPQTLGDLSPDTLDGMMYSFDSTVNPDGDWKQESASTNMVEGKGYIVRGPELAPGPPPAFTEYTANFIGVPNNGNYSITSVVTDKSYLLGNPYPSALDADTFLAANAGVLSGTLYFWTHKTEIGTGTSNLGTGALAYTSNDYATYNITGGVGIDVGTTTGPATSGGSTPSGKIPSGQGFFGTSIAAGTILYTNNMRVAANNSQFFRTTSTNKTAIEKHRIWLNLSNAQGAFKQTLVGYLTNATNVYDTRFDGESFDANEFVDFYSVNTGKNLVIQGRALPFVNSDLVPLGYRSTINGAFTINIDHADGVLTNQEVYLEDKLLNIVHNIKTEPYIFNTTAGTFNERFVLRYTNRTLGTNDLSLLENQVLISNKNKQIKVNSTVESINKVVVYDLLGKQIYAKDKINSKEFSLTNLVSSEQTIVVKVVLENGEIVTKKVVY